MISNNTIIFIILCFISFFGFHYIQIPNPIKEIPILLGIIIACQKGCNLQFKKEILIFYLCIVINMITCYLGRGQSIASYIRGNEFVNLFLIGSYFLFAHFKISLEKWEEVIVRLSVLFCICYLLQYILSPIVIFSGAANDVMQDGNSNIRIRLTGQALASLAYLKLANDLLLKWQLKKLFLLLLPLLVILFLGFRMQLFALLLITGFMFVKHFGFSFRILSKLVPFVIVGALIMSLPQVQNSIEHIEERQANDNFDNENYVRIREYIYYTENFPKNGFEKILGTGLPGLGSRYGKDVRDSVEYKMVWADWGLIGLSWMLGIPGVVAFVWIMIKGGLLKQDKRYLYISCWFFFMLFASILQREMYRPGNPFLIGIMLLIAQIASVKYRTK